MKIISYCSNVCRYRYYCYLLCYYCIGNKKTETLRDGFIEKIWKRKESNIRNLGNSASLREILMSSRVFYYFLFSIISLEYPLTPPPPPPLIRFCGVVYVHLKKFSAATSLINRTKWVYYSLYTTVFYIQMKINFFSGQMSFVLYTCHRFLVKRIST